jgi:P27 family predicted phage terminase small subunit
MGRRGPAPSPTAVLKLRGTFRKDRQSDSIRADDGAPTCPDWISDEAKHAWRYILPKLERMGVLSRIDRNALTRYCQLWGRWKQAELFIAKHGDTYPIKDESGKIKCLQQFPQVSIAHQLAAQLTRLEQEFGMTPSARSRIPLGAGSRVSDPSRQARLARFFAPPA